nr:PH domain-containing protein [Allosalinactinospora lopnorensis]
MGGRLKPLTAPLPRVLGWVWVGVAALLLVDLVVSEGDFNALIPGAVLLLTVGGTYVLWLRPCVVPTEHGVRLVNPLRETFVPWSAFTWADVTDVLRVHADGAVFRSWALRETKRRKVRDNLRRAGGYVDPGTEEDDPRTMRPVDFAAKRLRDEAEKRKARPMTAVAASAAGEPAGDAGGPAVPTAPTTTWSPGPVAALAGPLLVLLVVVLG